MQKRIIAGGPSDVYHILYLVKNWIFHVPRRSEIHLWRMPFLGNVRQQPSYNRWCCITCSTTVTTPAMIHQLPASGSVYLVTIYTKDMTATFRWVKGYNMYMQHKCMYIKSKSRNYFIVQQHITYNPNNSGIMSGTATATGILRSESCKWNCTN